MGTDRCDWLTCTTTSPMFSHFTTAIVRPPARNFADGLTSVDLGVPNVDRALVQHAAYCDALERHGCSLVRLPVDDQHPDSTFVEDTALILPNRGAILTRPGAPSRAGEVEAIGVALAPFFLNAHRIVAPGTLDAGDVCEVGTHAFIGVSQRTNAEGARQLSAWFARYNVTATTVDIRATSGILHLKSGVTALDEERLILIDALYHHVAFRTFNRVRSPSSEEYAANCVRVNDVVFVADGFPKTQALLTTLGYRLEVLDMSEFAKMDGGLSCLSLRF